MLTRSFMSEGRRIDNSQEKTASRAGTKIVSRRGRNACSRTERDGGRREGDNFIAISTYNHIVYCSSWFQPGLNFNVVSHASVTFPVCTSWYQQCRRKTETSTSPAIVDSLAARRGRQASRLRVVCSRSRYGCSRTHLMKPCQPLGTAVPRSNRAVVVQQFSVDSREPALALLRGLRLAACP